MNLQTPTAKVFHFIKFMPTGASTDLKTEPKEIEREKRERISARESCEWIKVAWTFDK